MNDRDLLKKLRISSKLDEHAKCIQLLISSIAITIEDCLELKQDISEDLANLITKTIKEYIKNLNLKGKRNEKN